MSILKTVTKPPNTVSQLLQEVEYGTTVVVKLRYQSIHRRFSTWINTLWNQVT